GVRRHVPGDVRRPGEVRQALQLHDLVGQLRGVLAPGKVVQRRDERAGEMADNEVPRQPGDDERRAGNELVGVAVDLRLVVLQPQDLWPRSLRRERIAAQREDAVLADLLVERHYLIRRARVHTIQDRALAQRV